MRPHADDSEDTRSFRDRRPGDHGVRDHHQAEQLGRLLADGGLGQLHALPRRNRLSRPPIAGHTDQFPDSAGTILATHSPAVLAAEQVCNGHGTPIG